MTFRLFKLLLCLFDFSLDFLDICFVFWVKLIFEECYKYNLWPISFWQQWHSNRYSYLDDYVRLVLKLDSLKIMTTTSIYNLKSVVTPLSAQLLQSTDHWYLIHSIIAKFVSSPHRLIIDRTARWCQLTRWWAIYTIYIAALIFSYTSLICIPWCLTVHIASVSNPLDMDVESWCVWYCCYFDFFKYGSWVRDSCL